MWKDLKLFTKNAGVFPLQVFPVPTLLGATILERDAFIIDCHQRWDTWTYKKREREREICIYVFNLEKVHYNLSWVPVPGRLSKCVLKRQMHKPQLCRFTVKNNAHRQIYKHFYSTCVETLLPRRCALSDRHVPATECQIMEE